MSNANRRNAILLLILGGIVGAAAGIFVTRWTMRAGCDGEVRSLMLTQAALRACFAASILQFEEQQQTDRVVARAEMELEASLYDTGRLTRDGARLGFAAPNLVRGVAEGRDYAKKHSLGSVQEADWFLEQVGYEE